MSAEKRINRKIGFGLGKGIPDDPESVKRALAEIASAPLVKVDVMSTALGIGKNTGYAQAQEGRFGAFRVGGQYRVPTAALRELLGLKPAETPVEQVAA